MKNYIAMHGDAELSCHASKKAAKASALEFLRAQREDRFHEVSVRDAQKLITVWDTDSIRYAKRRHC